MLEAMYYGPVCLFWKTCFYWFYIFFIFVFWVFQINIFQFNSIQLSRFHFYNITLANREQLQEGHSVEHKVKQCLFIIIIIIEDF